MNDTASAPALKVACVLAAMTFYQHIVWRPLSKIAKKSISGSSASVGFPRVLKISYWCDVTSRATPANVEQAVCLWDTRCVYL